MGGAPRFVTSPAVAPALVAARRADRMASGARLEPVSLVRVGALYFVLDGHHRVSVARALGLEVLPAVVRSSCTTALVDAGLSHADLDRKSAEREFLRDVPGRLMVTAAR